MAPSPERNTKLQVAYLLRGRVNLLLAIRYENSKLTVTFEEAAVLQDAMLVFVDLISHMIPQTPERDGVIETVQNLRKMLAKTLLPPIE